MSRIYILKATPPPFLAPWVTKNRIVNLCLFLQRVQGGYDGSSTEYKARQHEGHLSGFWGSSLERLRKTYPCFTHTNPFRAMWEYRQMQTVMVVIDELPGFHVLRKVILVIVIFLSFFLSFLKGIWNMDLYLNSNRKLECSVMSHSLKDTTWACMGLKNCA